MLDHLQTSLPPHLLNQFHDATPPMGGGESPLSPAINKGEPYFKNMKLISNPPDLKRWRERLFNVEDTIVLSEEECVGQSHVHGHVHRNTWRNRIVTNPKRILLI